MSASVKRAWHRLRANHPATRVEPNLDGGFRCGSCGEPLGIAIVTANGRTRPRKGFPPTR